MADEKPNVSNVSRQVSGTIPCKPEIRHAMEEKILRALIEFVEKHPDGIGYFAHRMQLSGSDFRKKAPMTPPYWRIQGRGGLSIDLMEHREHPIFNPSGPYYQIWAECEAFLAVLDSRMANEETKRLFEELFEKVKAIDPFKYQRMLIKILYLIEVANVPYVLKTKPMPPINSGEESRLNYILEAISE